MTDAILSIGKRGIDAPPRSGAQQVHRFHGGRDARRWGWWVWFPMSPSREDLQLRRVMKQLGHKATDLDRYIYLINLLDHDETLFYRTLMSDPARFLPIVYDPTIGEACLKFDHIYPPPARHVSVDHPQGACQGGAAQLAGQRRALHLRHQRRPHPGPG